MAFILIYFLFVLMVSFLGLELGITEQTITLERPSIGEPSALQTLGFAIIFVANGLSSFFQLVFFQADMPLLISGLLTTLNAGAIWKILRLARGGG